MNSKDKQFLKKICYQILIKDSNKKIKLLNRSSTERKKN